VARGRRKGLIRVGDVKLSTLSTDLRRHRRKRSLAGYGVTLVTIGVILLVVQLVGHEAGHLFSQVSEGLAS
jgi:hypothetical protein